MGEDKNTAVIFDDMDYIDPDDEEWRSACFADLLANGAAGEGTEYESEDDLTDEIMREFLSESRDGCLSDEVEGIADAIGGNHLVCMGTAELWDGVRHGGFAAEDIEDAIAKDMGRDCMYLRIWDEEGHLFIQGTHHDGYDTVEVRPLSEKGEELYLSYLHDGEIYLPESCPFENEHALLKELFTREDLSVTPHFAERHYGTVYKHGAEPAPAPARMQNQDAPVPAQRR